MSSSTRTTPKGGKGTKSEKSHKSEGGKGNIDKQHRDTQPHSKNEDPVIKEKVKQLIEISQRTEEEVCLALHECDYDVHLASNMLLESVKTGEWEMTVKKKKSRQAASSKQDKAEDGAGGTDDWNDGNTGGGGGDKERGRNKSNGPNRLHGRHNDGRGWKGRERQENERNLEEGGGRGEYGRGDRRGGRGGPRGGGGRGRGGGRAGGRYPPRNSRGGGGGGGGSYNKPIDTWDNTWEGGTGDSGQAPAANHASEETWEDFPGTDEWSTEEYTGSLADTKVFTPSVQPVPETVEVEATLDLSQSLTIGQSSSVPVPAQSPVPPMVGTLTAAQSQYFSQLSQQNSDSNQYAAAQTYQNQTYESTPNTAQVFNNTSQYNTSPQPFVNQVGNTYPNTGYQPVSSSYPPTQEQPPSQQPTRTKTQRARVPPPSKIPSSAVEMPGELNNIGYVDIQFGAMDIIDNSSFDSVDVKYSGSNSGNLDTSLSSNTNNLDLNPPTNQSTNLDAYSTKTNIQSSISTALSQSLSNTESIPQTSDHLTNTYSSTVRTTQAGSTVTPSAVTATSLDALSKSAEGHSYPQASTYNSYQPKTAGYNSSYSTAQTTTSSYVTNQASYVNSQPTSYNTPTGNSYPNSYSSTTAYQSNTNSFPSITQAGGTYQSTNAAYPQNTSQSVYGGNSGLGSTSNFGSTTTSQYNNYNSSANHKIKDSAYDNSSNAVNSSQVTATNMATSTSTTLSLSQTTISNSKTTTALGVAPVMSTPYIMGQVPYFQQPIYSYEDMQLLQQRMPHMTTPYYDVSYQTPTTLAAVREAAAVGYSLSSDGRNAYAAAGRGGDSSSPAPNAAGAAGGAGQGPTGVSALAAQQGHQHQQAVAAAAQPILAAAGTAPPFFYAATAFNTIAPNYAQFGTMYTQLPAATNAHGSNSSTQYAKPGTYGSGYSSYDALNQTQDYSKSGYVASTQGQKGTAGNASSTGTAGSDLSAMYSKTHTALGKVNSYEKQGFHSGTPPPFTGALHGSQAAGLAPSGTGYAPQVYIPAQMMHQPLHQMDVRHQGRRVDSGNTGGQRSQASNQNKSGAKQAYQASYWNQN